MTDKNKTKKQLIDELAKAYRRIKKLEKPSNALKHSEEALRESELYLKKAQIMAHIGPLETVPPFSERGGIC